MMIVFGYIILYCYQWLQNRQRRMAYRRLVINGARKASIVIRSIAESVKTVSETPASSLIQSNTICTAQLFAQEGNKQVYTLHPRACLDLNCWVSYLDSPFDDDSAEADGKHFILLETYPPSNEEEFLSQSQLLLSKKNQVKVVDCATPLAWRGGTPFGIVAKCTTENLLKLMIAYMDGHLVLDDMLILQQMISIDIVGQASSLLRTSSVVDAAAYSATANTPHSVSPSTSPLPSRVWSPIFTELRSQTPVGSSFRGSNESLAVSLPDTQDFIGDEHAGESREFNEECASIEDMLHTEAGSGEALSAPIAELAPEALTPIHRRKMANGKPPNIVVYCGKKDTARQFDSVRETLNQCLNTDRYVIYQLKHEHVLTTPWQENSLLLVISSDKVYDGVDEAFLEYFRQGGSVISFTSAFDSQIVERVKCSGMFGVCKINYKQWREVMVINTPLRYAANTLSLLPDVTLRPLAEDSATHGSVLVEATHDISQGVAILSQVNLDKDAMAMAISPKIFADLKQANPARCAIIADLLDHLGLDCHHTQVDPHTHALLFSPKQDKHDQFLKSIEHRLNQNLLRSRHLTLQVIKSSSELPAEVTGDTVPLYVGPHSHLTEKFPFDLDLYASHLATRVLGQTVIYAEVMPTTMTVIDSLMLGLPEDQGLVTIASRQTTGKGRGGNVWLNPVGCASWSSHVRLSMSSRLCQSLGFVQHIAAVAAIHAVRSITGYEELDIQLKWPNDIYFSDKIKMGGILVQSTIMQGMFYANIGIGINVNNSNPTICINDIIKQYNQSHGANLPLLTVEQVIACTLNTMETLIDAFQQDGPASLLPLYYKYWLHRSKQVKVESEGNCDAVIVGLDEDGYLELRRLDDSTNFSVQPDGNSFDMMRNLVSTKRT